jgi:hypothetical protein
MLGLNLIIATITIHSTSALFQSLGFRQSSSISTLKNDILSLARETNRGLTESKLQREKMEKMFVDLEGKYTSREPLKNKALSAVWELRYTTSDSILGRQSKFSEKTGPILQTIDVANLYAENSETETYFGLVSLPRKVHFTSHCQASLHFPSILFSSHEQI